MIKAYISSRSLKTGAPKGFTKYNGEIVEFVRSNVKKYTDKEIGELVRGEFKIPMNADAVRNLKVLQGIKSGVKGWLFKKGHTPKNKVFVGMNSCLSKDRRVLERLHIRKTILHKIKEK